MATSESSVTSSESSGSDLTKRALIGAAVAGCASGAMIGIFSKVECSIMDTCVGDTVVNTCVGDNLKS